MFEGILMDLETKPLRDIKNFLKNALDFMRRSRTRTKTKRIINIVFKNR